MHRVPEGEPVLPQVLFFLPVDIFPAGDDPDGPGIHLSAQTHRWSLFFIHNKPSPAKGGAVRPFPCPIFASCRKLEKNMQTS